MQTRHTGQLGRREQQAADAEVFIPSPSRWRVSSVDAAVPSNAPGAAFRATAVPVASPFLELKREIKQEAVTSANRRSKSVAATTDDSHSLGGHLHSPDTAMLSEWRRHLADSSFAGGGAADGLLEQSGPARPHYRTPPRRQMEVVSPNTRRRTILEPYGLTDAGDRYNAPSAWRRTRTTTTNSSSSGRLQKAEGPERCREGESDVDREQSRPAARPHSAPRRMPHKNRESHLCNAAMEKKTGRGLGLLNPANCVLANGLPAGMVVSSSGGGVIAAAGATTTTSANAAPTGLRDGGNLPSTQAVRAYRAGIALATGIDPAAARDRGHYSTKSSGWRRTDDAAQRAEGPGWESAPLPAPYESVGRRLCVREPGKASQLPSRAVSPATRTSASCNASSSLRSPAAALPRATEAESPPSPGKWVWTRRESSQQQSTTRKSAISYEKPPPFPIVASSRSGDDSDAYADRDAGYSPPDRPSTRSAARLRDALLPVSSPLAAGVAGGKGSHGRTQRAYDPADIMEAALAARFGSVGEVNARPSAIVPAHYRLQRQRQPNAAVLFPECGDDEVGEEDEDGDVEYTRSECAQIDPRVAELAGRRRAHSRSSAASFLNLRGASGDLAIVEASENKSEEKLAREQAKRREAAEAEETAAAEARRLLLFPPLLSPLLQEVDQCLYAHGLGSLNEIWRANSGALAEVLSSVGFSPKERRVILWELARMVRSTSTTCAVAI